MLFVDGENLTIRLQELAAAMPARLNHGSHYLADVYVWPPNHPPRRAFAQLEEFLQPSAIRAYYFTSAVGDTATLENIREALWTIGFQPEVFKRDSKSGKSKGVDIALTTTMLSHAALGNYDVAVLVAGDGDYLPLVNEVKRLGRSVCVAFFRQPGGGLSPALRLAADQFLNLAEIFIPLLVV
jgi:uncharacterized LabA/DUF88 family protein